VSPQLLQSPDLVDQLVEVSRREPVRVIALPIRIVGGIQIRRVQEHEVT
jgi:hypothetical protein